MIGGTVTTIVGCVYVLTHPSFYEGIKAVVDSFVKGITAVVDSFVKGITAVVDSFVKGIVIVLNFLPEWARPLSLSVFAASCVDRKFPVVITNGIGRSVYDGSIETANILRYAAVSLRDVATALWPFMTTENISLFFGISMMMAYSLKLAAAAMNLIQLAFAGIVGNSIRTPGINDPNFLNTSSVRQATQTGQPSS